MENVVHKINKLYKYVPSNWGLSINVKRCLYEGILVALVFYGAETEAMSSAEWRKVNVLQKKYLSSVVGVMQIESAMKRYMEELK